MMCVPAAWMHISKHTLLIPATVIAKPFSTSSTKPMPESHESDPEEIGNGFKIGRDSCVNCRWKIIMRCSILCCRLCSAYERQSIYQPSSIRRAPYERN